MQLQAAFYPRGSTTLVTTVAVQATTTDGSNTPASYRVRCILASGDAYLTWSTTNVGLTAAGAPTAGPNVPSAFTIGMTTKQTEIFNGIGTWFISSVANAFEVTPGEGV